jgi:hypothetical protein
MMLTAGERQLTLHSVNTSGAEYLLLWMLVITSAQEAALEIGTVPGQSL